MKSFRSTAIVGVIVALFVGYVVWDQKQSEDDKARKAESEKLVPAKDATIVAFILTNKSGTLRVKKEDSSWKVLEPVADNADQGAVRAYLDMIKEEKGQIMKSDQVKWSDYFLDPPLASLTLIMADQSEIKISLGQNASFDGQQFLRKGESLILGSGNWSRIMEKGVGELRDKSLYRASVEPESVLIKNKSKDLDAQVEFVKTDGLWSVKGLTREDLDNEKLQSFLDDLKMLKASDFVPEKKNDTAALSKHGLDRPERVVVVKFPKEVSPGEWRLEVGPLSDSNYYGMSSNLESLFKLSGVSADKLQVTKDSFRNPRLAFKFAQDEVKKIKIEFDKTQWDLVEKDGQWVLPKAKEGQVVQVEKVKSLIEKVGQLEVKDFPIKKKGLGQPKATLGFSNSDGREIFSLRWGEDYTMPYGSSKGENLILAKSSVSNEMLAIAKYEIEQLAVKELVTTKSEAITTPPSDQR